PLPDLTRRPHLLPPDLFHPLSIGVEGNGEIITEIEPLCGSSYSFSSNCSCYSCKPTAKASTTPTGEAHEAEAALAAALAALVAASHSKPNGN
ncbi:hypothetical protein BOX15_Mlig032721g1, partial [Macrostomum lignano]